jgi:integrase
MARKIGFLYKRGCTWWIGYSRRGRSFRESTGSTKESEAKRLLAKRLGEISEGKLPGVCFDRIKWDELAEDYLLDFKLQGRRSIRRAKSAMYHLDEHFGGMRVPEITSATVDQYIEKRLAEGMTKGTVRRELAVLKAAFRLGMKRTPPKVDRLPYIRDLAAALPRQGFFEHHEYLHVLKALPEHLRPVLTFAYKTGWRKSEVVGLTWGRVDLREGIVRLEADETKNSQARTIYLDPELYALLRTQDEKKLKGVAYVFPNDKGTGPIRSFSAAWQSACKRAGCPGKLFHDLRRTAYRNMVRSGVPERVAMMVCGWKTRATADRYNVTSPDDLKRAALKQYEHLQAASVTISGTVEHPTEDNLATSLH